MLCTICVYNFHFLLQVSEAESPGDGTPDKPRSVEKTEKG